MKRRWFALLPVLLLLGLFSGCGSELPAVYVQSVGRIMGYGPMGRFNICAGQVTAQDEVKIERDESRKVAELRVEAGQTVSAGDVLFVYDTDEIQLTIDKAELEIEQMKNSLTDYDEQIAQLEKEKKTAPESEQLSYTVQIQSLQTDRKETEYNITVRERELEALRSTSDNGEITAPISGKVKSVNENGGYDNYTGQPLPYITLLPDGAYRVKGTVNELNRDGFYPGMRVTVRSRLDETQTWSGTVTQIDTTPEEQNGNNVIYYGAMESDMTSSSSYPFYVDLDDTDGLLLGQHVFIEPETGEAGLYLDASYILGSEEEGFYVWAAKGDRIEKRKISVGAFDDSLYRYEITGGLTAEDRIAFPSEDIREGAPVTDTAPTPDEPTPDDDFVDGMDDGFVDGVDDGFAVTPETAPPMAGG